MGLGIESGSQRILNQNGKSLDLAILSDVIRKTSETGIVVHGFFMLGFPTETEKEIKETIRYALSLKLDRANFSKVTPFPGTKLHERFMDSQLGLDIDWSDFNFYTYKSDWCEVSYKKINRYQKLAHFLFYARPKYFFNIVKYIKLSQIKYIIKRFRNMGKEKR